MGTITHKFVNPVADDPAFSGTKPSDWNDDHDFVLSAADVGADPAGTAAAAVAALGGTLGTAAYEPTTTFATAGHTHAQLHDRQHSVTGANDHTFPGGTTTFLRADGTFAAPPSAGDGGFALKYAFGSGTGASPAAGVIQYNNATPASATNLYINETDAGGISVDIILDNTHVYDIIMVSNADRSVYHLYRLTAEFTSGSGVDTIPVAWVSGTTANFSNTDTVYVSFSKNDDALYNANTSSQSLGTGRTYVAGSFLKAPATGFRVGTILRWKICCSKTAAGTTAAVLDVAFGTAGTTADTARCSFTQASAQTAIVDTAIFDITCIIRSVGASGVAAASFGCTNNTADATGFRTFCGSAVSAGFANNGAGIGAGICMTPGASAAWTVVTVDAEICNI